MLVSICKRAKKKKKGAVDGTADGTASVGVSKHFNGLHLHLPYFKEQMTLSRVWNMMRHMPLGMLN